MDLDEDLTIASLAAPAAEGKPSLITLSPENQRIVREALAEVPEGHTTAILTADLEGVSAIVATKWHSRWRAAAFVTKPWSGDLNAGVEVKVSF